MSQNRENSLRVYLNFDISEVEAAILALFFKNFKATLVYLTNLRNQDLRRNFKSLLLKYELLLSKCQNIKECIKQMDKDKVLRQFIEYIMPELIRKSWSFHLRDEPKIILHEIRKGSLHFDISIKDLLLFGVAAYGIHRGYTSLDKVLLILVMYILTTQCIDNYEACKKLQDFLKHLIDIQIK